MNVSVKHNGSNITSHVVKYDREHKICTGIGMLEVEIENTYSGTFDPWDSIDIYENGSLSCRYFVSSVSENQPSSTFSVTAQDNSKRLSDYFITDSYLINYPSYTRYWIETFLHEVGISYTFTTDSHGSLLSNNTALGLMTAYEQIMSLLQMSGWYITFTGTGRATIGRLDFDKARSGGSLGNRDIIEIKVDKNDRMYRNRVVVWGNGDPSTSRWVFADVRKPTKWDYDRRDLRTILISNSNIPTVADAFMLANQALTEFARLNTEKYLTVTGARGLRPGDVVSLKTKVFTGKGMVTTFGTSMSRQGLVSNITMDERCPRLFGFFNMGGYVYVGTYGSGVWRKHILDYRNGTPSGVVLSGLAANIYSGGWFDYSSGLMDMSITDLHINNGVLASVASSGSIYYSVEDETPWIPINLSGLQVTYSGTIIDQTVYSGIMGRACIIDRDTNFLRYAVDTRSGVNLGDFLMETEFAISGAFTYATSGVVTSGVSTSGHSWILDVNPYDGVIANSYPVWVSGIGASGINYNITVYDIENDGSSDYVEALSFGSGIIPRDLMNGEYSSVEFGGNYYQQMSYDPNYRTAMSYSGVPTPILQSNNSIVDGALGTVFAVWDYVPERGAYNASSTVSGGKPYFRVTKVIVNIDQTLTETNYQNSGDTGDGAAISITRQSDDIYQFYCLSSSSIVRYDYNILTNSVTRTVIGTKPDGTVQLVSNGNLYIAETIPNTYLSDMLDFEVKLHKVVLSTGATSTRSVVSKTGTAPHVTWFNEPSPILLPYGDGDVVLICPYTEMTWVNYVPLDQTYRVKLHRYYQAGFSSGGTDEMIYDFTGDTGYVGNENSFGTLSHSIITTGITNSQHIAINKDKVCATYSLGVTTLMSSTRVEDFGTSINRYLASATSASSKFNAKRVYNMQGMTDYGLMRTGNDAAGYTFTKFNPDNGEAVGTIANPTGYRLYDFAGVDYFNGELIFRASTSVSSYSLAFLEVISITSSGVVTRRYDCITAETSVYMVTAGWFWGSNITSNTFYFIRPTPITGYFPMYMVLQRDGWDFNVVKSGYFRERLDISLYSPLVTMGRVVSTTETFFISQDGGVLETSHVAMSGYNLGVTASSGQMFQLGITADDFRYSDFEDTVESGTSRKLFVVYSGGNVGSIDLWTLEAFSGEFISPSGHANRVELSNFCMPDQYVFVSVSGYAGSGWGFYQKSPSTISGYDMTTSGVFVDYSSGYPQARTTIIRLDDSI